LVSSSQGVTMATTLYYVQSDTLPQIKLTLTNEDTNTPKNLTDCKVSMHVKPATGTGVKFTRPATFPVSTNLTGDATGICYINWLNGDLNRPAGDYNAEIEIYNTSSGSRETIYDTIKLVIREDIADIEPVSAPTNPTPAPSGPDPT